ASQLVVKIGVAKTGVTIDSVFQADPIKVENWTRKAAAGLARMKAKREVARQRKQEYYSLTFA
ncbi:hypothetical protein SJ593_28325, partial [Citrobacter freundii]|nr:hypothetical protein [Citrobacter freundii]MDX7506709.1 hypothetical protein [Citrobacter freundii]